MEGEENIKGRSQMQLRRSRPVIAKEGKKEGKRRKRERENVSAARRALIYISPFSFFLLSNFFCVSHGFPPARISAGTEKEKKEESWPLLARRPSLVLPQEEEGSLKKKEDEDEAFLTLRERPSVRPPRLKKTAPLWEREGSCQQKIPSKGEN